MSETPPDAKSDDDHQSLPGGEKNAFEWAVFVLGCTLTISVLACLIVESFREHPRRTPVIVIRWDAASQREGGFDLPITVSNTGDETAEYLRVEMTFTPPVGDPERAILLFDSLPGHGSAKGYATFSSNPQQGIVTGRAAGLRGALTIIRAIMIDRPDRKTYSPTRSCALQHRQTPCPT